MLLRGVVALTFSVRDPCLEICLDSQRARENLELKNTMSIKRLKQPLPARVESYIERLVIAQGRHKGERFVVLPWQRRFLKGCFNRRGDAALSLARGGGKSTFTAGIACAAFNGPLARSDSDVVIVRVQSRTR